MSSRRTLLRSATALVALTVSGPTIAWADEPIPVVATFSILGDMVERIGGEHVSVTTLVGPDGDAHVYQPTPRDARAVSEADVMIINGLEFEGWLERLSEAAAFDGSMVVATTGIEPIAYEDDHHDHGDDHAGHDHDHDHDHGDDHAGHDHDHDHDHGDDHAGHDHDHDHDHGKDHAGHDHDHDHEHGDDHAGHDHDHDHDHAEAAHDHDDHGHHGHDHGAFDPHAWQSIGHAVTYVDNIAAGLAQADPENAAAFYENRAAYVAELEALEAEVAAMMEALPESARTVVTSHDAFQYLGQDYGLTFLAPQGLSTEAEASAQDVAGLITQIREEGISAVFVESITDNRLLEQIASETGATIGGTLYSDALSGPDGPASTYIDMMRHNMTTLTEALAGSG